MAAPSYDENVAKIKESLKDPARVDVAHLHSAETHDAFKLHSIVGSPESRVWLEAAVSKEFAFYDPARIETFERADRLLQTMGPARTAVRATASVRLGSNDGTGAPPGQAEDILADDSTLLPIELLRTTSVEGPGVVGGIRGVFAGSTADYAKSALRLAALADRLIVPPSPTVGAALQPPTQQPLPRIAPTLADVADRYLAANTEIATILSSRRHLGQSNRCTPNNVKPPTHCTPLLMGDRYASEDPDTRILLGCKYYGQCNATRCCDMCDYTQYAALGKRRAAREVNSLKTSHNARVPKGKYPVKPKPSTDGKRPGKDGILLSYDEFTDEYSGDEEEAKTAWDAAVFDPIRLLTQFPEAFCAPPTMWSDNDAGWNGGRPVELTKSIKLASSVQQLREFCSSAESQVTAAKKIVNGMHVPSPSQTRAQSDLKRAEDNLGKLKALRDDKLAALGGLHPGESIDDVIGTLSCLVSGPIKYKKAAKGSRFFAKGPCADDQPPLEMSQVDDPSFAGICNYYSAVPPSLVLDCTDDGVAFLPCSNDTSPAATHAVSIDNNRDVTDICTDANEWDAKYNLAAVNRKRFNNSIGVMACACTDSQDKKRFQQKTRATIAYDASGGVVYFQELTRVMAAMATRHILLGIMCHMKRIPDNTTNLQRMNGLLVKDGKVAPLGPTPFAAVKAVFDAMQVRRPVANRWSRQTCNAEHAYDHAQMLSRLRVLAVEMTAVANEAAKLLPVDKSTKLLTSDARSAAMLAANACVRILLREYNRVLYGTKCPPLRRSQLLDCLDMMIAAENMIHEPGFQRRYRVVALVSELYRSKDVVLWPQFMLDRFHAICRAVDVWMTGTSVVDEIKANPTEQPATYVTRALTHYEAALTTTGRGNLSAHLKTLSTMYPTKAVLRRTALHWLVHASMTVPLVENNVDTAVATLTTTSGFSHTFVWPTVSPTSVWIPVEAAVVSTSGVPLLTPTENPELDAAWVNSARDAAPVKGRVNFVMAKHTDQLIFTVVTHTNQYVVAFNLSTSTCTTRTAVTTLTSGLTADSAFNGVSVRIHLLHDARTTVAWWKYTRSAKWYTHTTHKLGANKRTSNRIVAQLTGKRRTDRVDRKTKTTPKTVRSYKYIRLLTPTLEYVQSVDDGNSGGTTLVHDDATNPKSKTCNLGELNLDICWFDRGAFSITNQAAFDKCLTSFQSRPDSVNNAALHADLCALFGAIAGTNVGATLPFHLMTKHKQHLGRVEHINSSLRNTVQSCLKRAEAAGRLPHDAVHRYVHASNVDVVSFCGERWLCNTDRCSRVLDEIVCTGKEDVKTNPRKPKTVHLVRCESDRQSEFAIRYLVCEAVDAHARRYPESIQHDLTLLLHNLEHNTDGADPGIKGLIVSSIKGAVSGTSSHPHVYYIFP